ncbi:hypothetical protein Pst134EA_024367 [Puccinia striiformis f. sp. tritici]|uniref:hypothetical protein n=1 Tax=Puccinia striiformis f. sp. tritici TaxID=168172 RepID=UPI0020076885|nr:hypothetical protein Pst134EA_024367 [Puccinia striiformis f. sp. tritici]KAH9453500.1 hypothetical protein Pst134EA_024367 [Puccinia striiformis f. sp. tritici]
MTMNPFQQVIVRRFASGVNLRMPLQPAKQRKTTPIRNPRRPHLPDPVDTDPTAQKFKLAEFPTAMLVIREPAGIPTLKDSLIKPATIEKDSTTASSSPIDLTTTTTLSHPNTTSITPDQAKQIQELRTKHSITQLSNKFNIPRILVSILGPSNSQERNQIHVRNSMKAIRKESRWSVGKIVRRQEKIIRRSQW